MLLDTFEKLELSKEESSPPSHSATLFTAGLLIFILVASTTAAGFLFYRHRQNTDPQNYKKNSQKKRNCQNANEEFSEIRYLTNDDEHLDFTLQTPDQEPDG